MNDERNKSAAEVVEGKPRQRTVPRSGPKRAAAREVDLSKLPESGLWRTPDASITTGGAANAEDRKAQGHAIGLHDELLLGGMVKLMPTPSARDHLPPHSQEYIAAKKAQGHGMSNLNDAMSGSLNPTWVEWLMGYPLGWTDCGDSGTPSSRKSRSRS